MENILNNRTKADSGSGLFGREGMMRKLIVPALLAILASVFPVGAQEQSRRALAEELMNVTDARSMFDKNISIMREMLKEQTAPVKGEQEASKDRTFEVISRYLTWDKMKDDFISVYTEIFTEDEMKGMIAFYRTPSGQALLKKQPLLLQRTMEVSQKWVEDAMPKIVKELSTPAPKAKTK